MANLKKEEKWIVGLAVIGWVAAFVVIFGILAA